MGLNLLRHFDLRINFREESIELYIRTSLQEAAPTPVLSSS
jgi:hypothetical protein